MEKIDNSKSTFYLDENRSYNGWIEVVEVTDEGKVYNLVGEKEAAPRRTESSYTVKEVKMFTKIFVGGGPLHKIDHRLVFPVFADVGNFGENLKKLHKKLVEKKL